MFYPYAFHMQYVVREAAKSAGLWSSAPTMEEVTPQQIEKFNSVVRLALVCDICHLNNTNGGGRVMHVQFHNINTVSVCRPSHYVPH